MMHNLTVAEQIKGLKNRDFSSLELTQHYLNRIDNSNLNAFISVTSDQAINQAKMADSILAKGNAASLTGIPYAHKDILVRILWRYCRVRALWRYGPMCWVTRKTSWRI